MKNLSLRAGTRPGAVCLSIAVCIVLGLGCRKAGNIEEELRNFQQVNLVANKALYDPATVDPTLQNGWGLAWAPSGIAWVNAEADGLSELYTAAGAIVRKPVNIPSPTDSVGGAPIGIVFNSTKGFLLPNKAVANFIFDGGDGVISAWNGAAGNNAFRIADNAVTSAYTGLTLAASGGANYLYAANFRAGKIQVWDTAWNPVTWMPFHDAAIPSGFAPFNIQSVGAWLVVNYAKVGANGRQEVGAGLGFTDIFTTAGSFVRRLASRGVLNSPWGVTMAPAAFLQQADMKGSTGGESGSGSGSGSGDGSGSGSGPGSGSGKMDPTQPVILIGNFGDGRINVFTLDGVYLGQLQSHNRVIAINGLWALGFAPTTATTISQDWLFFTAGPAKEADGIFGYLVKQ
jgi:uncharacterized protein (TIGR03118 family)